MVLALGLMVVSALIYQPSALFYVVPLAAALIVQRHRSLAQTARWLGTHLGFVVGSLGLGLLCDDRSVRVGRIREIRAGRLRASWSEKVAWFLQETLPNGSACSS